MFYKDLIYWQCQIKSIYALIGTQKVRLYLNGKTLLLLMLLFFYVFYNKQSETSVSFTHMAVVEEVGRKPREIFSVVAGAADPRSVYHLTLPLLIST